MDRNDTAEYPATMQRVMPAACVAAPLTAGARYRFTCAAIAGSACLPVGAPVLPVAVIHRIDTRPGVA